MHKVFFGLHNYHIDTISVKKLPYCKKYVPKVKWAYKRLLTKDHFIPSKLARGYFLHS